MVILAMTSDMPNYLMTTASTMEGVDLQIWSGNTHLGVGHHRMAPLPSKPERHPQGKGTKAVKADKTGERQDGQDRQDV